MVTGVQEEQTRSGIESAVSEDPESEVSWSEAHAAGATLLPKLHSAKLNSRSGT